MVHYIEMTRSLGYGTRANRDAYTPYDVTKQVASMSKLSAHSLRYFNREKGIIELIIQR